MINKHELLELYWSELPIGKDNSVTYEHLSDMWGKNPRSVRKILHDLSIYDNGDNMILIRSSHGAGFYKTDDRADIAAYRAECLSRGRRTFAPLRKIDRVLNPDSGQLSFANNLKAARLASGKTQYEVCDLMNKIDPCLDAIMLSKMENGRCFPTPLQLAHLAAIYGCTTRELVNYDLYYPDDFAEYSDLQSAQNA